MTTDRNCEFVADEKKGWQRCINCGQQFAVPWPQRLVVNCKAIGEPGDMVRPPDRGCCSPPLIDSDGTVIDG